MEKRLNNSSSHPPQWLNLQLIVTALETVQDLIVISLCIGLFCFMVLELREMFFSLLPPLNFKHGEHPGFAKASNGQEIVEVSTTKF